MSLTFLFLQKKHESFKKRQEKETEVRKEQEEDPDDLLDDEEKEMFDECTEEDLIEVAAMLKMNSLLTNDQISAIEDGKKPTGSFHQSIKAAVPAPIVTEAEEETDLDVVVLMRCLKEDTDDLYFICINNIPKLEKNVLHEIFKRIGLSQKVRHVSLALTGINDDDAKLFARHLRYNETLETLNLESNMISARGIEPLMKSLTKHPNVREIKVSNQKNALGGQGEEQMANCIEQNPNIIKFGYSFMNSSARNKADRAILQHNDNIRQLKRQGKGTYDLKVESKKRDATKCPWIVVKSRMKSGLLGELVAQMGCMEGAE